MLECLKINLNCHYCSDVKAVPDVDISTALTSQQCHMPDIGIPASFELVWYHAISICITQIMAKGATNPKQNFPVYPFSLPIPFIVIYNLACSASCFSVKWYIWSSDLGILLGLVIEYISNCYIHVQVALFSGSSPVEREPGWFHHMHSDVLYAILVFKLLPLHTSALYIVYCPWFNHVLGTGLPCWPSQHWISLSITAKSTWNAKQRTVSPENK